jgi:hypothetical protein
MKEEIMKDLRYVTLINILDWIRNNAPSEKEYKRFHSKIPDDMDFSRGQAFIHLFLLAKFGIESFDERAQLISDGPNDGGLDAFYISEAERTVYLIQSKFKNTASNFRGEAISAADLVKMELERILQGDTTDSNGNTYNPKILEFQVKFNQATKKQVFKNKVIFLANIKSLNDFQIRKLTANLDYETFDFERSYLELVKPVCSGTHYDPEKIVIELNVAEKASPQLKQSVNTTYGDCDITAIFVPTIEIAKAMSKYKNAILRYNPRNYLGLSRNPVNKDIRSSISSLSHNDFALLNNGLTILADDQDLTMFTGTKNVGRLTLTNPQIINGGQTAYTLSEIFEKEIESQPNIFDGKEVLVRVIILRQEESRDSESKKYKFIDAISTSTNKQTAVKEADRHSSNPILVGIQEDIFRKFGYFVELKQGEFYNGRDKKFISRDLIVDRIVR